MLTQGSLHYRLATLGYQKRNTYGVEMFISWCDWRQYTHEYMLDCAEKVQRLQRCEMRVDILFMAYFIEISMITYHIYFININQSIGY